MYSTTALVSICIPTYNCENYIEATINCLINQTYKNIEIIVVDDGSTDATARILRQIADERFSYIQQPNKGAASARNKAYSISKGGFIKFMDADDLLNPGCIEAQMKRIFDNPDCIASAKWGRFYARDASDFKLAPEKVWMDLPGIDWLVNSLIDAGSNMVQPGIFLIPRNLIENAGPWNEALSLIDDFEFMVRVIKNSSCVLFCEDAVLMYRSGLTDSLSGKKTGKHMLSAFNALNLGINGILEIKNDARSRLACANTYQRLAYEFFPAYPDLYYKTEQEIIKLGGSNINIGGGKMYMFFSKLIGWKKAEKVKKFLKGTLKN